MCVVFVVAIAAGRRCLTILPADHVTRATTELPMAAGQGKTGQAVVEGFAIEAHDICRPALMLRMAGLASCIARDCVAVKPAPVRDVRSDVLVAVEAEIGELGAVLRIVTFTAVALQLCVRL